MNRPRGGGRASALLQKVSTQLKGERVPTVPKEEDELNAYLNTLSKKTAQQAKSINFSDFGDISISSSDNLSTPKQKSPELGAGSKFLKKKKPPEPKIDEDEDSDQVWKKKTTQNTSALLNKSSSLTKKQPVSKKQTSLLSNQNVFSIDSDSDSEKVRLSRLDTPTDISIGHDGRKFMKRPETPKVTKEIVDKKSKKDGGFKGAKERNKKIGSALTSEEESLADFMQRLSSSDSTPRPRSPNKFLKRPAEGAPPQPRSPSPDSKPFRYTPSPRSPKRSPIIGRRTPSPLPLHSRSQDSDMVDSITSEVVDTQDTSSSNDLFKDVMDINALQPALPEVKKSKSKEKKNSFKKEKTKKEKKTADSDIFFGLQTVDDLMGRVSDDDESIASEISEVHIERGHTQTRKDSLSGIQTFGSKASERKQITLSHDYDESISERIGITSKYDKSSIASEVRTQYSEDTVGEYTTGFDSDTESITESYSESVLPTKWKSPPAKDYDRSYSESYTSYSDSKTYSKSLRKPTSKHRPPTRSIQVQTGEEPGLSYSWKTPMATVGPQYGLDFVDPSPIATHVISADALEIMTAYSPAMIALHDMLKQQLLLTQSFLSAQHRIYNNYQSSLDSNYHYTTLEDTKEYIKQHRKKPITFKEAYKMVSAEMDS